MRRKKREDALDELKEKFSLWREQREKRGPTPPELLAGSDALRKKMPLGHIAKVLRLNPTDIKRRLIRLSEPTGPLRSQGKVEKKKSPPSFVKLIMDPALPPAPFQPKEVGVIECENPRGYKLRIYTSPGNSDQVQGWLKDSFLRD